MEIQYLQEFATLAETGNFLDAAENLFISQSSLSKHIKKLEDELGCPLFDRTTRKVRLNDNGRILLEYASQILQLNYQCISVLHSAADSKTQTINIGSIPVTTSYQITDLVWSFRKWNSNIQVNLVEGESSDLKEMLRQNKVEAAFIRDMNEEDNEFVRIPLETDHLCAALPKEHPLAGRRKVSLKELEPEDFLLLDKGTLLHSLVLKSCLTYGFQPNVVYTNKRAESILDLVEKGMGVTLLMKKPLEKLHNPNVSLVDIDPPIETSIKLYYLKNRPVSAEMVHFSNMIQAISKDNDKY